MERNIPHNASETIDFYKRTIYSVLRSKSENRISGLEEVHAAMDSTMHPDARSSSPDYNALIYSILRVPPCMQKVRRLILGQNIHMFYSQGYEDVENWPIVTAAARRRICRYDGAETLAVFINSKSDIEDIVPIVTALQIEWNKFHELLQNTDKKLIPKNKKGSDEAKEYEVSPWTLLWNDERYYLDESGEFHVSKGDFNPPYGWSGISGIVVSILSVLGLAKKNKMVMKSNEANDYVNRSDVKYSVQSDKLVSSITTHHKISSDSGGSHGGGYSHSGSSGGFHGGGGGRHG